MTAKTMRSFAAGLLVAGGALGIVYYTNDGSTSSSAESVKSEEEMRQTLTASGFVVEDQQTWDQLENDLQEALALAEHPEDTNGDGDSSEDQEEQVVYRTILHVVPGMTSIDVGEMLEDVGIVDSGYDFYEEVDSRGLSNDLRPQVTGELTSEMSLEEVVDAFF